MSVDPALTHTLALISPSPDLEILLFTKVLILALAPALALLTCSTDLHGRGNMAGSVTLNSASTGAYAAVAWDNSTRTGARPATVHILQRSTSCNGPVSPAVGKAALLIVPRTLRARGHADIRRSVLESYFLPCSVHRLSGYEPGG